jgi:hypothetical protein
MQGPVGLNGREYKLLLDQARFPGACSKSTAKAFWARKLKPIIDADIDARKSGASRASGEPAQTEQRSVAFLDSKRGALAGEDFCLRLRIDVEKDGKPKGNPEVTLKFRTPDFLLAAEYFRIAKNQGDETKIEEDIAPLQVAREGKAVAVPKRLSVYSRFSVSTKIRDFDGRFKKLGDVLERFGALEHYLDDKGKVARDATLVAGPTICEWVYGDNKVDLGENLDARFALTFWYVYAAGDARHPWKRASSGDDPRIVEISFDFDTEEGRMERAAAERASNLFLAMQGKLHVNRTETSKTALGLPAGA